MIPKGITDSHFREAAKEIGKSGVPFHRSSVHYDVVLDGKKYPPKYVISLAAKIAFGKEHPPTKFNAVEAKNYLIGRGFEVFDRRDVHSISIKSEDDESTFPEGREAYRIHKFRERDGRIAEIAKRKRFDATGELTCDACGFDFSLVYGKLGLGFIEAHHIVPVSSLDGKKKTKVSDFALVCSNCHRMLHRGSKGLTIEELRDLVKPGVW